MHFGQVALLLLLSATLATSQPSESAIRQTVDRYLSALRRSDRDALTTLARANASRFSTGGTRLGNLVSGRAPWRDLNKVSYFVRHVEFLRPDAAMAVGIWRDATANALYPSGAFTFTLVQEGSEWKVNSVQETLSQPLTPLDPSFKQSPIAHDGDWEILFDGKTADHWLTMSGSRDLAGSWRVADGSLITVLNGSLDLRSDCEYTTFELKWKWMAAERSNSGVKYRLYGSDTITFGPARFAAGWEYQMADDNGDPGAKVDHKQKSGALYGVVPVSKPSAKPPGQWNESRLIVAQDHVEHWLNGVMTASYPIDVPFASPISLQHHRSEVRFQDIRIRSLQPRN